jgi:hypothetical protein
MSRSLDVCPIFCDVVPRRLAGLVLGWFPPSFPLAHHRAAVSFSPVKPKTLGSMEVPQ